MKTLKLLGCLVALLTFVSCANLSRLGQRLGITSPESRESPRLSEEETLIEEGQKALSKADFSEAREKFEALLTNHIGSAYTSEAELGLGRSLQGLGLYPESVTAFKKVVAKRKANPKLAGLASYYMAYSFEALGQPEQAIATLLDAKSASQHLPEPMAEAEIPARLAVSYLRMGQQELGRRYLNDAEQGYLKVSGGEDQSASPAWRAEIFYRMGQFPADSVTYENFDQALASMSLAQTYLVAAIEQDDSHWSKQALEQVQHNYETLWELVVNVPVAPTKDPMIAVQNKKEKIQELLSSYQTALDELKRLQIFPTEDNEWATALTQRTEAWTARADELLQTLPEKNLLTDEAKEFMSLRRGGGRAAPTKPARRETSSPDQKPMDKNESASEDPNL